MSALSRKREVPAIAGAVRRRHSRQTRPWPPMALDCLGLAALAVLCIVLALIGAAAWQLLRHSHLPF